MNGYENINIQYLGAIICGHCLSIGGCREYGRSQTNNVEKLQTTPALHACGNRAHGSCDMHVNSGPVNWFHKPGIDPDVAPPNPTRFSRPNKCSTKCYHSLVGFHIAINPENLPNRQRCGGSNAILQSTLNRILLGDQ